MRPDISCRNDQHGFTLVEMAIVLLIVGLLIGVTLKAQEIVSNTKVTSTISEFRSIEQSVKNFYTFFNAWPGDMTNATTRLPNCDGTVLTQCYNGGTSVGTAGDGVVGTAGIIGNVILLPSEERVQFWRHMLAAGLFAAQTDASGNIAWNAALPRAAIGGGWRIGNYDATGPIQAGDPAPAIPPLAGHYLELTGDPGAATSAAPANSLPLTPIRAAQIDRKVDNGVFGTGAVVGFDAGNCFDAGNPIGYDEAVQANDCGLYLLIQNQ